MIRTLVVDDDFRVAELHCAYVERVKGFSVAGRASTGAEALESVERLRPDLVLLDIYLPDMSGLDVLQRLREDDHPPVDVISITAAREVESIRAAMRGGVVHYLIKPFLFATFEEKLLHMPRPMTAWSIWRGRIRATWIGSSARCDPRTTKCCLRVCPK